MTAIALLTELRDSGMVVDLHDDRVVVSPRDRITDQVRARVKRHKHDLVSHLHLEHRIRAMAGRWSYSPDELTLAFDDATRNPTSYALWLDWDELVCSSGKAL